MGTEPIAHVEKSREPVQSFEVNCSHNVHRDRTAWSEHQAGTFGWRARHREMDRGGNRRLSPRGERFHQVISARQRTFNPLLFTVVAE